MKGVAVARSTVDKLNGGGEGLIYKNSTVLFTARLKSRHRYCPMSRPQSRAPHQSLCAAPVDPPHGCYIQFSGQWLLRPDMRVTNPANKANYRINLETIYRQKYASPTNPSSWPGDYAAGQTGYTGHSVLQGPHPRTATVL